VIPIVMGYNDSVFLGRGWHELQRGPRDVPSRWSSDSGEFVLPGTTNVTTVQALVCGLGPELTAGLSLYAGDQRVAHQADALLNEGWRLVEFSNLHCPDTAKWWSLRSELEVSPGVFEPRTFVPAQCLGNGDYRELGFLAAAISFS